jgi:hypothetical protein
MSGNGTDGIHHEPDDQPASQPSFPQPPGPSLWVVRDKIYLLQFSDGSYRGGLVCTQSGEPVIATLENMLAVRQWLTDMGDEIPPSS